MEGNAPRILRRGPYRLEAATLVLCLVLCLGRVVTAQEPSTAPAKPESQPATAQEPPAASGNPESRPTTAQEPSAAPANSESRAVTAQEPSTLRANPESNAIQYPRLQFLQAEMYSHYAYTDLGPGQVVERDVVYKTANRFRVNLQSSGATFIEARVESGSSFTNPYNPSGFGNDERFRLNVKSVYLQRSFGPAIQAEAGGLDYDYGAGTHLAYAAGDGWLTGYRLRILSSHSKGSWRPNRITATVGYVGDFTRPNFFSRAYRMGDVNYIQLLAYKRFGEHFEGSAEGDRIAAIQFTRETVRFTRLRSRVVDTATTEATIRASNGTAVAWAVSLANTLDNRSWLHTGLIFSDVPASVFSQNNQQFLLNWGEAGLGKRGGFLLRFVPTSNLNFGALVTRKLDSTANVARWRAVVSVSYQLSDLVNPIFRIHR